MGSNSYDTPTKDRKAEGYCPGCEGVVNRLGVECTTSDWADEQPSFSGRGETVMGVCSTSTGQAPLADVVKVRDLVPARHATLTPLALTCRCFIQRHVRVY